MLLTPPFLSQLPVCVSVFDHRHFNPVQRRRLGLTLHQLELEPQARLCLTFHRVSIQDFISLNHNCAGMSGRGLTLHAFNRIGMHIAVDALCVNMVACLIHCEFALCTLVCQIDALCVNMVAYLIHCEFALCTLVCQIDALCVNMVAYLIHCEFALCTLVCQIDALCVNMVACLIHCEFALVLWYVNSNASFLSMTLNWTMSCNTSE